MRSEVLVVAHDAGGAEIIAAYIRAQKKSVMFRSYVGGPAKAIFRRSRIPFTEIRDAKSIRGVITSHRDASYVLLDTGRWSLIPFRALQEAKRHSIKTCAYLDSWKLYKERFIDPKTHRMILPDEIWVGDKPAFKLARKSFRRTVIRFVANQYFESVRSRVRSLRKHARSGRTILFLSQGPRYTPDVESSKVQFRLQMLVDALRTAAGKCTLRIRLHPSDTPTRYQGTVNSAPKDVRIEVSSEVDIVKDIAQAKLVIGPESVALAVAFMTGIPTIRLISSRQAATLPFFITAVRNRKELQRAIKRWGIGDAKFLRGLGEKGIRR